MSRSTHAFARGLALGVVFCAATLAGCREHPPETDERPPAEPATLTLLTYNVLADQVGLPERPRALLSLLERSGADVIALQEVDTWFLTELRAQAWVGRDYHGTEIDGAVAAPGGQYILSRFPVERSSFDVLPGAQQRTVLVARLIVGAGRLDVATTHMESALEDGPVRARQLEQIFSRLGPEGDAVVMGDFNTGDGEPEGGRIPASFVDLWAALRPGEPGYTWDEERSLMARQGSFAGEPSRRLDRILLRSARWAPARIAIVGDTPVNAQAGLFPSDHFGLLAEARAIEP
jgi:tyrosyl-DNA phosphodiesterase 2